MTYLGMGILKIESLMAYVSDIFVLKIPKISRKELYFPQKEIVMAYISRSCDFPKVKMGRWVAYIII